MEKNIEQYIIKILVDINSIKNAEQIMNVIVEIISLDELLVDFKKNEKLINSKLKLIKNILNDLYTISNQNYESINNVIQVINSANSIKGSTITLKETDDFTLVQKINGKNIVEFKSGPKYKGNLKGDKYEGKGKYIYESDDIYEGDYEDNKNKGKGVYYFKEGHKNEGEFIDDKMERRGTYYYNDEKYDRLKYEGGWKNYLKDGRGIYYFKKGDKYEGLETSINLINKKLLENSIINISDAFEIKRICNAVIVARAIDFFNQLRIAWENWDIIISRIYYILRKYIEIKEENEINYLYRKLMQWKYNAQIMTENSSGYRIANWAKNIFFFAKARQNWIYLSNKYDFYVNKCFLSQVKKRLRNWLKLRDMAEKLRIRFINVGLDQLYDGVNYIKILILTRNLLINLEERNKFLAKRFFIRKLYMQVKKLYERDNILETSMNLIDKKTLENSVINISDVFEIKNIYNAVPVARAVDFFNQIRITWDNNIYRTKEEELNKKYNKNTDLNIKLKKNEINYNQIEEERVKPKGEISKFPFTLLKNEYIILLIIMTKDEKIIFPLLCKNTDKFSKIKEIFFEKFPEYEKRKGKFYNRNKNKFLMMNESLEKCKIKTNDIIIFEFE